MQIKAAVVHERSGPFAIETVELCAPRPDELIVRVVASGMCQTDLHGRDGYYAKTIPAFSATKAPAWFMRSAARCALGAAAIMSSCRFRGAGLAKIASSTCIAIACTPSPLKMSGTRADGSTLLSKNGAPVYSAFFQQSSFGTFALTQERYAVKVRKDAPLELLGPLACSGQTGAGAVLNVMQPKPGDSFAVFGVGAVGLSALMAAKIAGCDPIIAVDMHAHRLALARELGATHRSITRSCADVVARNPCDHRRRRALFDRYIGAARGVSRGGRVR